MFRVVWVRSLEWLLVLLLLGKNSQAPLVRLLATNTVW